MIFPSSSPYFSAYSASSAGSPHATALPNAVALLPTMRGPGRVHLAGRAAAPASTTISSPDIALLRLGRRSAIMPAHPAVASTTALARTDAHADIDWANVIALLDRVEPLLLPPPPPPPSHVLPEHQPHRSDSTAVAVASTTTTTTTTATTTTALSAPTPHSTALVSYERWRLGRRMTTALAATRKPYPKAPTLWELIRKDPEKGVKQALHDGIIALSFVTGMAIIGSIIMYLTAPLAIAEFIFGSLGLILATLSALVFARYNVAKNIAELYRDKSKPAGKGAKGKKKKYDDKRGDEAQRKLCRGTKKLHMKCREATPEESVKMVKTLREKQPELFEKLLKGELG